MVGVTSDFTVVPDARKCLLLASERGSPRTEYLVRSSNRRKRRRFEGSWPSTRARPTSLRKMQQYWASARRVSPSIWSVQTISLTPIRYFIVRNLFTLLVTSLGRSNRLILLKTSYHTIRSIHNSQRCIAARQFLEALVLRKYAPLLPAMPRIGVPIFSLIILRVHGRYCSHTLVRPYHMLTVVLYTRYR